MAIAKISKWVIWLLLIFLFGTLLRVYKLGQIPGSMHRDELAIAYNAYSILETGKDEWGVSLPFVFKSFGDFKQPGAIYMTVPGIAMFGLTPFGSRLPSSLFSSLAILFGFLFVKDIFKSNKMALITSIVFTLSFWHIRDSRNIYEPVSIITLNILSYWALYKAKDKAKYLYVSILFFGLSILVYNTPLFIFPLLFVLWMVKVLREKKNTNKKLWFSVFFVVMVMVLGTLLLTFQVSEGKGETTIFFSSQLKDEHQERWYRYWRSGIPLYSLLTKTDRLFQIGYNFVKSYVASVDISYLFFNGGNNDWHNSKPIRFGDMNPVLLPFFMIGLIHLFKKRKKLENHFMLLLLFVSPVASSLTVDAPNTNRLIDLHFVVMVISVFGFWKILKKSKSNLHRKIIWMSVLVFFIFTGQFLFRYFIIYNKVLTKPWYPDVPELMRKVKSEQDKFDEIYIEPPVPASYIYYAFYSQLPPHILQESSRQESRNFNPVGKLGNVVFGKYEPSLNGKKILVVNYANQQSNKDNLVFTIFDWDGKEIWEGSVL